MEDNQILPNANAHMYFDKDGYITENETADISGHHMSVDDFESNSFGASSMYTSDDGTMDYINDADAAYEM